MTSPIIDAQVHVWTDTVAAHLPGLVIQPNAPFPAPVLDLYLDAAGIDGAVIVQPIHAGADHTAVCETVLAAPSRFAGVCVPPVETNAMHTFLATPGDWWQGLRLRPKLPAERLAFDSDTILPLWDVAAAHRKTVSILAEPAHAGRIAELAASYPEVPVIVDHLCGARPDDPAHFAILADLAKVPNVHVKLSGLHYVSAQSFPHADCHELIRHTVVAFSPERMLWSSDYPHGLAFAPYSRSAAILDAADLGLERADRDLILGGNARRLYWR